MIISIMIKWFSKLNKKVTFSLYLPPYAPKKGVRLQQKHETTILINPRTNNQIADGIFANKPGQYWIKTADCTCVAFVGRTSAGIVHAGWRGLASGICQKMKSFFDEEIDVYVFPFAKKCCYEFGKEEGIKYFGKSYLTKNDNRFYLDMDRILHNQLGNNISLSKECTICSKDLASRRGNKKGFNWIKMEISDI